MGATRASAAFADNANRKTTNPISRDRLGDRIRQPKPSENRERQALPFVIPAKAGIQMIEAKLAPEIKREQQPTNPFPLYGLAGVG